MNHVSRTLAAALHRRGARDRPGGGAPRRPGAAGHRARHRQAGDRRHRQRHRHRELDQQLLLRAARRGLRRRRRHAEHRRPARASSAKSGSVGTLIVQRGGRLNAIGTRTRADRVHERSARRQPRAAATGAASSSTAARRSTSRAARASARPTPASTAATNPNDNSGTLRYVRVEFAGVEFSPDNELNGIAFQGVGRGGTYEFIQVHMNRDDALEWFGGTADIKYAVASNAADDSFDWTFGWSGRAQFIAITPARRRCRQRHRGRQQRVQQQPAAALESADLQHHALRRSRHATKAPRARAPPTCAAARRSRFATS